MWTADKILPIFLSGLLAAALTQLATFLRDYLTKSEQGRTSAMFVTLALENFAAVALYRAEQIELFNGSAGTMGEPYVGVPAFPDFPPTTDWRAIGAKLSMKVLSGQGAVTAAQTKLDGILAVTDASHTADDTRIECVRVGYKLLTVAGEVRARFKLGRREHGGRFDLHAQYERRLPDVEKADEADDRFHESIGNTVKAIKRRSRQAPTQ
ncbi:hypothetical protein E1H18_4783 [Caulobacter sp. RHG1]|nr:hypothetical protein [Caulobacter sp. RHG1]